MLIIPKVQVSGKYFVGIPCVLSYLVGLPTVFSKPVGMPILFDCTNASLFRNIYSPEKYSFVMLVKKL